MTYTETCVFRSFVQCIFRLSFLRDGARNDVRSTNKALFTYSEYKSIKKSRSLLAKVATKEMMVICKLIREI